MTMLSPSAIEEAGVRRTLENSLAIESFDEEWERSMAIEWGSA